jgi:predicted acyltransferase
MRRSATPNWVGPTSTDMIFPAFLVAIGMAMTFSFAARIERGASRGKLLLHALQRSAALIVLGLLVNGFPDYHLHTIRIPGILQHIALCYLAGSMLYLAVFHKQTGRRMAAVAAITATLLVLHWVLLQLVPVPGFGAGRLDSLGNLGAYIDRSVFGVRHLWAYGTTPGYGVTFDPDGLLLTISSLGNLLIGALAGEWLRTNHSSSRKTVLLVAASVVLIVAGMALSPWLPLNKKLWTSTFTLLSSGVAVLAFTALYFVVDVKLWRSHNAHPCIRHQRNPGLCAVEHPHYAWRPHPRRVGCVSPHSAQLGIPPWLRQLDAADQRVARLRHPHRAAQSRHPLSAVSQAYLPAPLTPRYSEL